jgi:hypothetical protein
MTSPGDGVYQSTDAGPPAPSQAGSHPAFADPGHPSDPDVVYVASQGRPRAEPGTRSSLPGMAGRGYDHTVADRRRRRRRWTRQPSDSLRGLVISGCLAGAKREPGSGLWNRWNWRPWAKLSGAPLMGKTGVTFPRGPGLVWAIVEAEKGGLCKARTPAGTGAWSTPTGVQTRSEYRSLRRPRDRETVPS